MPRRGTSGYHLEITEALQRACDRTLRNHGQGDVCAWNIEKGNVCSDSEHTLKGVKLQKYY
jgi:hypothetical protein